MDRTRIAILGGGNMGEAVAKGIRDGGRRVVTLAPGEIIFAEPDLSRHARLTNGGHCRAVPTAREALDTLRPDGTIIIAVKPQVFPALAAAIRGQVGSRLVISIMAGKKASHVHAELGSTCRVVRVMPSLPIVASSGMSAVSHGPGSTTEDVKFALELFKTMGDCLEIDESLMDAFTALAASGPAYVAYLAEAMTEVGIVLGFTRAQSWRIVSQTVYGASVLIADEPDSAEPVRARITSKGGTTSAAVDVLDGADLKGVVIRAITTARDRGRELGLG
jgi:pyrroline-5-carboxylate reductase